MGVAGDLLATYQNVIDDLVLVTGMADADTHTMELGVAQMRNDVAQAWSKSEALGAAVKPTFAPPQTTLAPTSRAMASTSDSSNDNRRQPESRLPGERV